jgi:hypothetical protein
MTPLRQSREDIRSRAIAIVAIVATLVSVLAVMVAWWMTPRGLHEGARVAPERSAPIAGVDRQPLAAPARSARTQARERARLDRYAPVDGERAQIPIDRAIELVAGGRRPEGAGATAFAGEAR